MLTNRIIALESFASACLEQLRFPDLFIKNTSTKRVHSSTNNLMKTVSLGNSYNETNEKLPHEKQCRSMGTHNSRDLSNKCQVQALTACPASQNVLPWRWNLYALMEAPKASKIPPITGLVLSQGDFQGAQGGAEREAAKGTNPCTCIQTI